MRYLFSFEHEAFLPLPVIEKPNYTSTPFGNFGGSIELYQEWLSKKIPVPKEYLNSFVDGQEYSENEFKKQLQRLMKDGSWMNEDWATELELIERKLQFRYVALPHPIHPLSATTTLEANMKNKPVFMRE